MSNNDYLNLDSSDENSNKLSLAQNSLIKYIYCCCEYKENGIFDKFFKEEIIKFNNDINCINYLEIDLIMFIESLNFRELSFITN